MIITVVNKRGYKRLQRKKRKTTLLLLIALVAIVLYGLRFIKLPYTDDQLIKSLGFWFTIPSLALLFLSHLIDLNKLNIKKVDKKIFA